MYRLAGPGLPPSMALMVTAAIVAVVGFVALIPDVPLGAEMQTSRSVSLHVEETTGIRRTRYPVNAQVPFPQGALARADQVRLLLDDEEIPAQCAARSRWPDGSVQWLTVDFNASIGPEETRSYRVEYGPGVSIGAGPGRGLALVEDAAAIQVGRVDPVVSYGRSWPFGPVSTRHPVAPSTPTSFVRTTELSSFRSDPYVQRSVPKSHTHGCGPSASGL